MEDDAEIWKRNEELLEAARHSASESDRGTTLVIAAQIDECLRRLIESFLIDSKEVRELFDGPYAPFGSLSGKTRGAYLMGLISKGELERIDAIRAVRNVFAHHVNATFEHEKIKKICAKPPVFDGVMCDRDAFLHMAQNTIYPIIYRDIKTKWKREELVDPVPANPNSPASTS